MRRCALWALHFRMLCCTPPCIIASYIDAGWCYASAAERLQQSICCKMRHWYVRYGNAGLKPSNQIITHTACLTIPLTGQTLAGPSRHPTSHCGAFMLSGKLPGRPATVTVFGPPEQRTLLEHTARFVPLVVAVFEALLGCRLPYPALHVVRAAATTDHSAPSGWVVHLCRWWTRFDSLLSRLSYMAVDACSRPA